MSKRKRQRRPGGRRESDSARPESSLRSRVHDPVARQRVAAFLIAVGVVIFAQHWVSHLALFAVISERADDLVIGYPTAGILVLTGLMMLPGTDKKRRSHR